jgi:hypothetical protein
MIGYPDLLATLLHFGLINQEQFFEYQEQMQKEWDEYS